MVSPLVSVIIPTHNRPDFLRKTLASILEQSYTNIEILVVSNGINEKNRQVVASIDDPRISYFEQENSGGPASPRNHGIRKAKGEYLAFCDDDDIWMRDKLEKQLKTLEENAEYGLCYSKMLRFDEQKEWSVPHESGQADFQSLLYVNPVPISSVIIRKSLIDQYGGFSESSIVGKSEDYEFLLRHAITTKFYFLNENLIKYWAGLNRETAIDQNRALGDCLKYFMGNIGSYGLVITLGGFNRLTFIKPFFYQFHFLLKAAGYIIYRRFRMTFKCIFS